MTLPETTPAPAAPIVRPRLRRGALIAIIAGGLVVVLGLGAAAFALVNLVLGGGQSPSASAVAFPKNTVYWSEVTIDPSNEQRIEGFRFLNELDALRDAIEDSDLDVDLDDPGTNSELKESLWEFLLDGVASDLDTDLDYEDDIEPWIGSRVAVGMVPTDDYAQPPLIFAIEARDTDAGIEAIDELVDDLDADAEVGEHNGYVIVATGDIDIDDVYDEGTLNQSEQFAAASAGAGSWGLASAYVDLGALYAMVNEASTQDYTDVDYWIDEIESNPYAYVDDSAYEDYEDCSAFDSPENVGDEAYEDYECDYYYAYDGDYYEYYSDFAFAWAEDHAEQLADDKVAEYQDYADQQQAAVERLDGTTAFIVTRFVDASFEVSGVVSGVKDLVMTAGAGEEAALPASSMAVLSAAGLAETLDQALTDENLALSGTGLNAVSPYGTSGSSLTRDDVEDWFDDTLGLDFPDDLGDVLGTKVELVLDSDIDLDAAQSASDLGEVIETGAAIVITSDDPEATADAWDDLIERAEDSSGSDLGLDVEQEGNRVVVSSGDYLDTVLDPDERLGGSEAFRRALPEHAKAGVLLYLDIGELSDLVDDLTNGSGALEILDGAQALGISSTVESDDSYSFVIRLTTEAH
jgi:hypothetical protein